MKNGGSKIDLFEYRDYRSYLRDLYQKGKEEARGGYSFRSLSKKAGFKSSNFIMLVIQGKRNLTEESLTKLMRGLDLNHQEQEFFRYLVFLNQAKTHEEKNDYYRHLLGSRKFSRKKPIEKKEYEYYSAWYHPVVRELVISKDFDGTPGWISRRISPEITPEQAAKSMELLQELGFIQRNGEGRWKQASSIVSTGPELTSVVVHQYHKVLMDLSKEVMDRLTVRHRDTSALTLGVRREKLEELRSMIRHFRKEVLKLVSDDGDPEEVVQLNIQFYPVTKIAEKGDL